MRIRFRALLFAVAAASALFGLAACKPSGTGAFSRTDSADATELASLRAEVQRLRKENADLRLSPYQLALEVDAAMRAADEEKAIAAYKQLADNFPVSAETLEMKKHLDVFMAQRRAHDEEEKRIAALGFKGLPVNASFAVQDTALTLGSVAVAKRWIFDSWGDGWRWMDAEKDRRMLIARVTVASKQKEPALFGIAAYAPDGSKLTRLGQMHYRFARWSSYGAFLGTTFDSRNEFSHSWKIPFSAAVAVSENDLKRRPIYLVATSEGCHSRHYERFGQPPVSWQPAECGTLKPTLTLDDFKAGGLAVLKRIE